MEKEIREMKAEIKCDAASVWLLDEDFVYPYIFVGPRGRDLEGLELARGEGLCGYCIETGEGLLINDILNDPRWYRLADAKTGYITSNLICLPIIINAECIGCIQLLNKEGGFSQADVARCKETIAVLVETL